jgi:hypothetical protein
VFSSEKHFAKFKAIFPKESYKLVKVSERFITKEMLPIEEPSITK